jgi:putative DNA primase/helicase
LDIDELFQCHYSYLTQCKQPWSNARFREVEIAITRHAEPLLEKPLEDRINLKNGIYYILEDRFEPHSEVNHSDYRTTIQIPITYDRNAKCPNADKFMGEVFPEGAELLFDIIGICMTSCTGQAKAIVLLGTGSNGKSAYLYGLRSLVGMSNCSTVTMHTLTDSRDRFATSNLVGKLVNAGDDTSQEEVMDTAVMKSIVSGNPIRIEGKFRQGINYVPFCKLVFGANHRLKAKDETSGYNRRIMHIPFSKTFATNPAKEREIYDMFESEQERSGVLNEILKRLKNTITGGFIIPDEARDLVDNFVPIDSLDEQLLRDTLIEDPNGKIPIHNLWAWCAREDYTANVEVLKGHIKYLFPNSKIGRPRYGGVQKPSFLGVSIRDKKDVFNGVSVEYSIMNCVIEDDISSAIEYLDPD